MIDWKMEYNSEKDLLIISEYGRHVQELIQHAKTIEEADKRQAFIERIVNLMQQMQPQARNVEDYREKLWKHVFRIAEYELQVTPPEGVSVSPEDARKQPDKIPYPEFEANYRHYGHNVQEMISRAMQMPEGPKRDGFVSAILSYMKLAYKTWNREHYVSDETIKADLEKLSGGAFKLDESMTIDNLTDGHSNHQRNGNGGSSGGGRRRSQSNGRSNRGRRSNRRSSRR